MRKLVVGTALAIACSLSIPSIALARGSGGHGSGGHSSGGHGSSGHGSSGHGSGGHGGHSGGGHASGGHHGGSPRGSGVPRGGGGSSNRGTLREGRESSAVRRSEFSNRRSEAFLPRGYRPYSTFGSGFFDPFWPAFLYSGYAYSGYAGPGYGAYGSIAPYPFDAFESSGSLRIKVKPRDAAVYVDGYYAGVVDEYDGVFQHLDLIPGPHHVEIVAPGYEPLAFDVTIEPHRKIDYRGTLVPVP